ncbi:putative glycosyltransferase (GT2) [Formosa agariphila KMM 3901]|uniref:Putative glycosyltransferase (GT2) n=1 Tax=Formosa agariphila (strain DSM 15362 / KCTC 12365 / LMG 23005 / KMM 3901 / M-2Alg 35-1) TaxID=1347342 RepID=T2KRP7_FORAG|nr:TIGR04282 family arsenosugar biosynthesis glycosyltransferase [Formosa agariphila]CDF80699.1 putative glycosyltransferase (GT2) [Formosa agariphila KMM 3901]
MGFLTSNDTEHDDEAIATFHFPTSKKALIIFARNPELGKCKTRLAKTIGDENALDIYRTLLQHTADIATGVKADSFVFYSEHIHKNDTWDDNTFRKKLQQGDDLGERMSHAFSDLFQNNYQKIIIIGSDILDLTTASINDAYNQLEHHDVVIGPAKDGGYYLLGMKTLHSSLFENKSWGTATVLKDSLKNLENKSVHLLEELNDIDTFEDIKEYPQFNKYSKHYD